MWTIACRDGNVTDSTTKFSPPAHRTHSINFLSFCFSLQTARKFCSFFWDFVLTFGEIEIQQQEEALFHMEYKIILSQNSFFFVYLCRLASLTHSLSLSLLYNYILILLLLLQGFIYSLRLLLIQSGGCFLIFCLSYFSLLLFLSILCFIVFFILMLRQFIYFYISSFVVVEKEIYSFC